MKRNVELRQERGRIVDEMGRLLDGVKGSHLTSEQKERFDKMDAEVRSLGRQIEAIEGSFSGSLPEAMFTGGLPEVRNGYDGAYNRFLRHGYEKISHADQQLLQEKRATIGVEGTPTGGAYPGYFRLCSAYRLHGVRGVCGEVRFGLLG